MGGEFGRFLLLTVWSTKSRDLWVLPMDTGSTRERKPVPYLRINALVSPARFSPDGRFVAYGSNESGTNEVYIHPFDPASPESSGTAGGKVKVSQGGGAAPHWAQNGKELLYVSPDGKLWSVDVTWTPQLRVSAPHLLGEFPQGNATIAPDGRRILLGVPAGSQEPTISVVLNWQAGLKK
jgi:Tol biopolymer transport system component